jgi:hypothetical protein
MSTYDSEGAPRRDEEEWKTTPFGVAVRKYVTVYFGEVMRLAEAGLHEQVERRLAHGAWRAREDLTRVPLDVLHRTDTLVSRARGLAQYGDPEVFESVVRIIMDTWA